MENDLDPWAKLKAMNRDHLQFKQEQIGRSRVVNTEQVETIVGLDENGDYVLDRVPILSTLEITKLRLLLQRFEQVTITKALSEIPPDNQFSYAEIKQLQELLKRFAHLGDTAPDPRFKESAQ